MAAYQTIRKRGLQPTSDILAHLMQKMTKQARDAAADLDDDPDEAIPNEDQKRYFVSPLPPVFGCAICVEYNQNNEVRKDIREHVDLYIYIYPMELWSFGQGNHVPPRSLGP